MTDNAADCHHRGHGPHPVDETCSCACHGVLGRQGDESDPWMPDDPDDDPSPESLLAYWQRANASPQSQRQLVADQWRLWRLARDLATALEESDSAEDPLDHGLTARDLHAVADRLYDADDSRLEQMTRVSVKFNTIRSRLRSLADAIEETDEA